MSDMLEGENMDKSELQYKCVNTDGKNEFRTGTKLVLKRKLNFE